jgi:hypothetical protein
MPKKQAIVNETAAVASSARAAKPKTPRVKAAQHSKVASTESAESVIAQSHPHEAYEAVAQIAYGYWESRGHQGGTALEDWLRAEHEYRQRLAATRL